MPKHIFNQPGQLSAGFIYLFVLIALVFTANISMAQTSSGYQTAQVPVQAQSGIVVQVRDVQLDASATAKTVGGVLGGAIAALLGSRAEEHKNSYVLTSAFGALGAAGGAIAASQFAVVPAQEIVVVLDDKRIIAVAQSTGDGERFFRGQKVFYLNGRVAPVLN